MACVFCQIIAKTKPSTIIYEDQSFIAILDQSPLFPGHTLLMPKQHVETLYDFANDQLAPLFLRVKLIGQAIEQSMSAQGSFIAMNNRVSQSVPHLHVHIVPRNKGDGLKGFFWPRKKYLDEQEEQLIQARIKKLLCDVT
jgi:histidine triad (HIT) family protein